MAPRRNGPCLASRAQRGGIVGSWPVNIPMGSARTTQQGVSARQLVVSGQDGFRAPRGTRSRGGGVSGPFLGVTSPPAEWRRLGGDGPGGRIPQGAGSPRGPDPQPAQLQRQISTATLWFAESEALRVFTLLAFAPAGAGPLRRHESKAWPPTGGGPRVGTRISQPDDGEPRSRLPEKQGAQVASGGNDLGSFKLRSGGMRYSLAPNVLPTPCRITARSSRGR